MRHHDRAHLLRRETPLALSGGTRDLRVDPENTFHLRDAQGTALMTTTRQLSLRDGFRVYVTEPMPWQVAVLSAVAVVQKYFSDGVAATV